MFDIQQRLEEMMDELERSWPTNFNKILKEFPHGGEPFYILTFCKFNQRIIPWEYKVYHQPRFSKPDALPGTILREVDPKKGTCEIIWTLPHREGFRLSQPGKMFYDPIVKDSIDEYMTGELDEKFEKV